MRRQQQLLFHAMTEMTIVAASRVRMPVGHSPAFTPPAAARSSRGAGPCQRRYN